MDGWAEGLNIKKQQAGRCGKKQGSWGKVVEEV